MKAPLDDKNISKMYKNSVVKAKSTMDTSMVGKESEKSRIKEEDTTEKLMAKEMNGSTEKLNKTTNKKNGNHKNQF